MKVSPAISINRTCHSHQWFLASKCEWGLPKLSSSGCCHPPWWQLRSWGNARGKVNKETRMAPDSWGVYERNEFSEPRDLHLPIHRRILNSLTGYLVFLTCLLNNNLWYSDYLPPLLQICIYSDSLSCLLGAVFSGLLRYCLLGLESLTLEPNKITLY